MSYCLNPSCPNPQNSDNTKFCLTCGSKLLLKERYRAIRPLGEGGFGRTFLAVDEDRLNAKCAIKQFLPQFQGSTALQKASEMFSREAVQLHELGEHPQIPDLLAYFESDKRLYLVQEYIDGLNLMQELQQYGAFSEEKIKEVLTDLLPVLQFIHEAGVIHRDIKPENILRRHASSKITGTRVGQLVLVDFGISKQGSDTELARTGTRTGTHGYAPMEQLRGGQAYPASDIYSLGVTCIVLLVKMMPDDLYDVMQGRWIWKEQLAKRGGSVSDRLAKVLDKMLHDLVRDRYQSAAEVLNDLTDTVITLPAAKQSTIQPLPAPKPSPLTTAGTSKPDVISTELEFVKSQVSQSQPVPQTSSSQGPSTPPKSANFDPILADLEALKTEFEEKS